MYAPDVIEFLLVHASMVDVQKCTSEAIHGANGYVLVGKYGVGDTFCTHANEWESACAQIIRNVIVVPAVHTSIMHA